jgi:SpoVK/Ycf46/Vps4 family AAA+-type ATPase
MKGFIKHLDTYKQSQPTTLEYCALIESINQNYQDNKLRPIITNNSYSSWQDKYEITLPSPTITKIFKEIDVKVHNLQDLIDLIDQNPLNPNYDYNIDLKSLHNIRGELQTLQDMVGLTQLKQAVIDQLLYFIQDLHKGSDGDYKHTVLTGPPGTGKTEVAKILGTIYSKIGTLQTAGFKKITRADLIAGYLGQTAMKTQKVIESSLGGVLFLDEAYSLGDPNQTDMFSKECVDTLCESLSDHKNNLMFIIAGYEDSLRDCFFSLNPGLDSRFLWRFSIDSYSPKELHQIFIKKVRDNKWEFEDVSEIPHSWFEKNKDHFKRFGRDMENLFTYTKIAHGRRIYGKSIAHRKSINKEDLEKGFEVFLKHKQDKTRPSVIYNMYL